MRTNFSCIYLSNPAKNIIWINFFTKNEGCISNHSSRPFIYKYIVTNLVHKVTIKMTNGNLV